MSIRALGLVMAVLVFLALSARAVAVPAEPPPRGDTTRYPEFTIVHTQSHKSSEAFDSRVEVSYRLSSMWEWRAFPEGLAELLKSQGTRSQVEPARAWQNTYLTGGGTPEELFRNRGSILGMKPGERLQFYASSREGQATSSSGDVYSVATIGDGLFELAKVGAGIRKVLDRDRQDSIPSSARVHAELVRTGTGAVLWFRDDNPPGGGYDDFIGNPCIGANLNISQAQWRSVFTYTFTNQELANWESLTRTNQAKLVDTQVSTADATLNYKAELRMTQSEDELEVSVEPESGYDQWIPEGNLEAPAKPGNSLTVYCQVHKKGDPAKPREAELTFTWKMVSSEKGVCNNWPSKGASGDSDLQFLKEENDDPYLIVDSPDSARSDGLAEKVRAVISSLDFGAYGTLHITAKDRKGKDLKVRIRGEEKADLALPFDENHNHIADAWEKQWAGGLRGQETDDDDAQPVGDGHTGDALSLYEEYRGFRISGGAELTANGGRPQELIKGHHVRTSPQVKDVFVCDTLGMGVGAFRVVGLQVHLVKPEECAASRNGAFNPHAINPNRGSFTRGEQYVLWVEAGVTGNGYAGEAIMKGGDPSVPRDCQRIKVSAPSASGSTWMRPDQETLVTLTHELAHACNVKHHGDGGTVDVVRSEYLADHTVETGEGLLASEEGGSQVSGDVHCYMGYTANFIQELKAPEFRVWDRDGQWYKATKWNVNTPRFAKYRFCDVPSSWELGPAGPPDVKNGRGDCNHQFCVNHLKH
jgi:hypothetical protein